MKNLSLLFIAFLLFQFTVVAQQGWYEQQHGVGVQNLSNLSDVSFLDENIGYAVGNRTNYQFGVFLKTINGGLDWESQFCDTCYGYNCVQFIGDKGWIGTLNGILATEDGGMNWSKQILLDSLGYPIENNISSIYFLDENLGWAFGQVLFHTTNGGTDWQPHYELGFDCGYGFSSVFFINENLGWLAFSPHGGCDPVPTYYRTTDGGNSWVDLSQPPQGFSDIFFINENIGWRIGSAGIEKSINGGIDWFSYGPNLGDFLIGSINFIDSLVGWAVSPGKIIHTTDGGDNWTEQWSLQHTSLRSVHFVDSNNGWAVGSSFNNGISRGIILHTTNGGVVPVELTSFIAQAENQKVILKWTTATELNNNGFEVQRGISESDFATIGFVKGQGTTTDQKEYSFIDNDLIDGKYFYRLKQVDYNGTYEYSDVIEVDVRSLNEYALEQNYPNPFNPATTIGYVLKEKANANLIILNAIGEAIAVLVNEEQDKGYHKVEFDASILPSGVYFYRLRTRSSGQDFIETKKMILLK